jgi:hypothetical protein
MVTVPSIIVLKSLLTGGIVAAYWWEDIMGWKKRFKLKFGKPAPKPTPVPVPTPPPNTVEKRLAKLEKLEERMVAQEREQRRMIDRIALFSGKVSETMTAFDDLKVEVTEIKDVAAAVVSTLDRLTKAVEWLRKKVEEGGAANEAEMQILADDLDATSAALADAVTKSGASGGV